MNRAIYGGKAEGMHLGDLQIWRDHDQEALQLGGFMRLPSVAPATDVGLLARNVFDAGGRFVVVKDVINFDTLDIANTLRFFEFLRELTSYGIMVEWRLKAGCDGLRWRDLWHLFPPSEVMFSTGTVGQALEFWRQQFYFGLCVMRRGPGMIEVRDRRSGRTECLRFTSPLHLDAIERLEKGAPVSSLAPDVLSEFEAAGVVAAIGDMRLWLPCRFRRSALSPVDFWFR